MTRILGILAVLCVAFILAPIVVVVAASFSAREIPEFPPSNLSLRWYAHALDQALFVQAALNSAWIAVAATAIATPIGLAAALALARGNFGGKEFVQTMLMMPIFVPSVVIGLAILLTSVEIGVRTPTARLVAAHVLITLPYLIRAIVASLSRVDVRIEEAAATLGANPLRRFWHITLPSVRPGLIAGVLFALIVSFDNVSVSLFLTTAKVNTLPLAIMNYVEYNFDPSIAAISTILVVLSVATALLLERLVGLRAAVGA